MTADLVRSPQLQLKLHLRAQLNHSIGRDAEKLGRGPGVSLHENEKPLAPARERLRSGGDEIFSAEVIRRLAGLGDDTALGRQRENLGDVRGLHEAVLRLDASEVVRERGHFDSLRDRYLRYLSRDDREQNDI